MDVKEILKHVDHTLLLQQATWEEIRQICDDAVKYGTASVCIPPSYVKQASEYVKGKMAVCTVIGFPNGYMTTKTKEFETKDALAPAAALTNQIFIVQPIQYIKIIAFPSIKVFCLGELFPFAKAGKINQHHCQFFHGLLWFGMLHKFPSRVL